MEKLGLCCRKLHKNVGSDFHASRYVPTQAVEVRGYADFVPLGSNVMPMLGTEDVMWTCNFRNGPIKRFKFPTIGDPDSVL
jgi:adenylylsulfate reductase subunit B